MNEKSFQLNYSVFDDLGELNKQDRELLQAAKKNAQGAYAPYSNFKVGAAVGLVNGKIVGGSNQENAAFPSGLCAERVAVFSASAKFPDVEMNAIAIYAATHSINDVLSPCGACRQVLREYESKQNQALRVLLSTSSTNIFLFNSVGILLPLAFHLDNFKKD